MISRKYRLRRWRVNKILKDPVSQKIGFFIVKCKPNKERFHKWALTLSRKFAKKAVDRVRKRRQIYESIREIQKTRTEDPEKKHYDLVLIPLKQILTCNYQKILQNVSDIFTYLDKLNS